MLIRSGRVRDFGLTPRQARFLGLVLEHSGVCLPRQDRTFAGIAHGRHTQRFLDKLIVGGFATTDLAAPAHAGHLQYKSERLMILDGVLAEPGVAWLGLARTVTLAAGRYRFTQTTDDGSRLWVDDQLQIDAWGVDGLTTHTVDLDLAAGDHTLRFQSVEYTGGATAQLAWALRTPVVLASGESLGENQTRVSLDGAYRLQYQGDGNLVVVRLADDSCAWSSQTNNTSVGATMMQPDGNLVIYNGDWTGIWSTGTWGHDGARLEIANDELAVIAADDTKLWWVSLAAAAGPRPAAGTAGAAPPAAGSGTRPRRLAVLAFILGLFAVGTRFLRRWSRTLARQAADRGPCAARRAPLQGTALLLTGMLLVPATGLAQIATQVIEYYHTDALGSVRAVTKQVNGQWQVVARHDFMPFGEEVAAPVPPPDKRLFTGKERDSETGMDYFGARYYRADLGRFTTVDPVQTTAENLVGPQRWNRYAYVSNNPLRYLDPDGRMQRDSKGNLIFQPVGNPTMATHPSGQSSTFQGGFLLADDGTQVAAARNVGTNHLMDTDCHGLTFADGQYLDQQ